MGSLDKHSFILAKASSGLSPYFTTFGNLFFVSSVIGATISAQFGMSRL